MRVCDCLNFVYYSYCLLKQATFIIVIRLFYSLRLLSYDGLIKLRMSTRLINENDADKVTIKP